MHLISASALKKFLELKTYKKQEERMGTVKIWYNEDDAEGTFRGVIKFSNKKIA